MASSRKARYPLRCRAPQRVRDRQRRCGLCPGRGSVEIIDTQRGPEFADPWVHRRDQIAVRRAHPPKSRGLLCPKFDSDATNRVSGVRHPNLRLGRARPKATRPGLPGTRGRSRREKSWHERQLVAEDHTKNRAPAPLLELPNRAKRPRNLSCRQRQQ